MMPPYMSVAFALNYIGWDTLFAMNCLHFLELKGLFLH